MYHFYIGEDLLPLPPERMTTQVGSTNEVVNLVSSGDYNIRKDIGLTDFQFEVFLPALPTTVQGITTDENFKPPGHYLDKFRQYKTEKQYIRLMIIRNTVADTNAQPTNLLVSIEDYTIREEGYDDGSFTVTLNLREHRPPKQTQTKVAYTSTNNAGQSVAHVYQEEIRPTKPTEKTHTVVPGDTLWAIAQRKLGNGARFQEIAVLNNISDPNLIFPNQVLRLP